jgi:hypothetical protein
MCAYEFKNEFPFEVTRCSARPITLDMAGMDSFEFERLNNEVISVVYPCGALLEGKSLIVSYGINDENLAIARLPWSRVEDNLEPVESKGVNFTATYRKPSKVDPEVFGSDESLATPLFWWDAAEKKFDGARGDRRFEIGNFGDIASRDIVERIAGRPTSKPIPKYRKLVSVGSVLHQARNGDVIWGSGVKGTVRELRPDIKELDIRAVRGPLTLDFLRESGFDVSKVTEVFDPGCLMKELYSDHIKTYDQAKNQEYGSFRIVPHYRDDLLFRRMYQDLHHSFLTVDCTPLQMVERMLGAEAVYSSSLHGVIFAESLGIPAYWLRSIGGEDGYKFYDYYYGTGRYNVRCFETLEEARSAPPMPLPVLRPKDYLATFPHDVMEPLANETFGLRPGMQVKLHNKMDDRLSKVIGWSPQYVRPGFDGWWMLGKEATCGLRLDIASGQTYDLKLTVRPFNHKHLPTAQALRVILGGTVCYDLQWEHGNSDPRTVTFAVTRDMMDGPFMRLQVEARHAVPPSSLKVAQIDDPVTCCIQKVEIVEKKP